MRNIYIIIAPVFLLMVSCKQAGTGVPAELPPLTIGVEKVMRRDMTDSIQIFGMVKLRQEAFLASQFDGRLAGFTLIRGDRVGKDQEIGIIVPPEREALNQVTGEINDQQRQILENEIREIPLYSPITGTVLEVMQHNGDVVQKGESIIHLADLEKLDVYGDLPVAYLPRVKPLRTLRVLFVDYPHAPVQLPVSALDGQVDALKQTLQIRLALENPREEYRPGMMVKIEIPDKVHLSALAVPRPALLEEEGIYSVFVLNDTRVEKRKIGIGIKHDDYVEVLSGLEEGDLVAVRKVYSLTDGMQVQVK
jgi:multidrug efflux pump subunit AcrA (membrane-fusion protein)